MKNDPDGVPEDDGAAPSADAAGAAEVRSGDDGIGDGFDAPGLGRTAGDELEDLGDLEPATVGARVPAGSARAAARASAARAGISTAKGRATPSRAAGPKRENIFKRVLRYLREVVSEMRKVIWPTRKEMITYSIVVVLFLVFMIVLTWALDLGFARAVLAIFG